jgi:hypothetical protein
MQIKKHDRSHMVELRDGSAWRIWPGDIPKTLQWLPTTEIDVADIEDEICSHALVDRSNGSRVRVMVAGSGQRGQDKLGRRVPTRGRLSSRSSWAFPSSPQHQPQHFLSAIAKQPAFSLPQPLRPSRS